MIASNVSADLGYSWISRDALADQNQWSLGVRFKF
jgi:opacity protein-like surface antigen